MRVRKAVIPAAGLGTRFLPATKTVPKEMIPVIDRPGIQYAVEECVRAGITDILIVTSRGKSSMEDHFDRAVELEERLAAAGKVTELAEVRRLSEIADVHYVRQKEALGFGHALGLARSHVGAEPFVALIPDEVVPEPGDGEEPLLERMIDVHTQRGTNVVMVQEVAIEEISAYGVITPLQRDGAVVRISEMIEKPSASEAASNLAARGRYVLTPEILDVIDRTPPGHGGEIQLTDGINVLAREGRVDAYIYEGPIYDVGKKVDYIEAILRLALRRHDLAGPVAELVEDLARELANP